MDSKLKNGRDRWAEKEKEKENKNENENIKQKQYQKNDKLVILVLNAYQSTN